MPEKKPSGLIPKEFFSFSTFGSLGGCALVAWIVSVVLIGILGKYWDVDPSLIGLIVAMAVSFASVLLSNGSKKAKEYVVAFFNGFLIYVTVIGFTNFMPLFKLDNQETTEPAPKAEIVANPAVSLHATPTHDALLATQAAPRTQEIATPNSFEEALFNSWLKKREKKAQRKHREENELRKKLGQSRQ